MVIIEYSLKRITAILEEIRRLEQIDLPYESSRIALKLLEQRFKDHEKSLRGLKKPPEPTPDVAINACRISLTDIYIYLPIFGFILRSTSVRTAFETYGPLLRIGRKILGSSTELILSSEWEYFPFTYSEIVSLPDFVLIGLPSQESENPLLLSLAGHELGHSIWGQNNIVNNFTDKVEEKIISEIKINFWDEYQEIYPIAKGKIEYLDTDLFLRKTWLPAYNYAILQLEEIFCDLIGLRIFAESYLYAITYIMAPRISGLRSPRYPNMKRRIAHLEEGAKEFNVNIPIEFSDSFEDYDEHDDSTIKLLIKLADITSASFISELIDIIKQISEEKVIQERSHDEVRKNKESFEKLVPIDKTTSITNILNAAWLCFHDNKLWKRNPSIRLEDKDRILKELALKSIEVFEINERLK